MTTIRVRQGNRIILVEAFRGSDGMIVGDRRGMKASRKLWRDTHKAADARAEEQGKPSFTPFRIFQRWSKRTAAH